MIFDHFCHVSLADVILNCIASNREQKPRWKLKVSKDKFAWLDTGILSKSSDPVVICSIYKTHNYELVYSASGVCGLTLKDDFGHCLEMCDQFQNVSLTRHFRPSPDRLLYSFSKLFRKFAKYFSRFYYFGHFRWDDTAQVLNLSVGWKLIGLLLATHSSGSMETRWGTRPADNWFNLINYGFRPRMASRLVHCLRITFKDCSDLRSFCYWTWVKCQVPSATGQEFRSEDFALLGSTYLICGVSSLELNLAPVGERTPCLSVTLATLTSLAVRFDADWHLRPPDVFCPVRV